MPEQQNDSLQNDREHKSKTRDDLFIDAFAANFPKLTFPLRRYLFFCCSSAKFTNVIVLQNRNEISQNTRGNSKKQSGKGLLRTLRLH